MAVQYRNINYTEILQMTTRSAVINGSPTPPTWVVSKSTEKARLHDLNAEPHLHPLPNNSSSPYFNGTGAIHKVRTGRGGGGGVWAKAYPNVLVNG